VNMQDFPKVQYSCVSVRTSEQQHMYTHVEDRLIDCAVFYIPSNTVYR